MKSWSGWLEGEHQCVMPKCLWTRSRRVPRVKVHNSFRHYINAIPKELSICRAASCLWVCEDFLLGLTILLPQG